MTASLVVFMSRLILSGRIYHMVRSSGWAQFLQDTGGFTDSEAREFLSRKYILLSTNVSVAKKVVNWLAEHGPGQKYDGERA